MNRSRVVLSLVLGGLLASAVFAGTVTPKTFQSAALGQSMTYHLYRPADYDAQVAAGTKFSVVYLMHWWIYKADGWHMSDGVRPNPQLDKCIDSVKGIICVAPQDETPFGSYKGTSWWVDSPVNPTWKYSTFLGTDLVNEVDATNQTNPVRASRGLSGPSMGGYGTLHNLRVQTDKFRVGYAIVAATDLTKWLNQYAIQIAIGNGNLVSYSPINHIADYKALDMKMAFQSGNCSGGCASPTQKDFFYDENVAFDAALTAGGVPHDFFNINTTGHDYPLPDQMVKILRYFESNFPTVRVAAPIAAHKVTGKTTVSKVVLATQAQKKASGVRGSYVGVDGKRLSTVPTSGIIFETK